MPDWLIPIVAAAVGALTVLAGTLVSAVIEERKEVRAIRSAALTEVRASILQRYVESAITPVQQDIALGLASVGQAQHLILRCLATEPHQMEYRFKLLDQLEAVSFSPRADCKFLALARLKHFGSEYFDLGLYAYRGIELYLVVAKDLVASMAAVADVQERLDDVMGTLPADLLVGGDLWNLTLEEGWSAIHHLDALAITISGSDFESPFDPFMMGSDDALLAKLREPIGKEIEEFRRREERGTRGKKRIRHDP